MMLSMQGRDDAASEIRKIIPKIIENIEKEAKE